MPNLKFLADMNISPITVGALKNKGWDIVRANEVMDVRRKDTDKNTNKIKKEIVMRAKSVEYLADILPDGHLSIPDELRKKLKQISKKKVKVSIEVKPIKAVEKKHPAFGIWADRLSEGSSAEIAEKLREKIESRANGAQ